MSIQAESSSTAPNGHFAELELDAPKQSIKLNMSKRSFHDDELSEPDDSVELGEDPDYELIRVAEARQRHEADLLEHHYEAPKVDRLQDEYVRCSPTRLQFNAMVS